MNYQFFLCDVFTRYAFQSNQLAVLLEAEGLSQEQMQQIAREFNFSKTTFVLPPEQGHTNRVKIFAPTSELPFAGHPNLGIAFVLHQNDYLGNQNLPSRVIFEETAGLIPMTIEAEEGETLLEPEAPASLTVVQSFEIVQVSKALNLPEEAISTHNHLSQLAFVGLPLLMVELNSIEFLKRASPNMVGFQSIHTRGVSMIHLYTHTQDEFDIRTRMFAPFEGVVEDPATGSADCALARFPAYLDEGKDGNFSWKIAQGV